jgi:hypothetical protein
VDELVLGNLVLDQSHDLEVAETVGAISRRSKSSWFRGSFTRATTLGTP